MIILKQIGNMKIVLETEDDRDLDLSWDDTGEVRRNLERGTYVAFVAKVSVRRTCPCCGKDTELGVDYLNNCIDTSLESFAHGARPDSPTTRRADYARDMMHQAIDDARRNSVRSHHQHAA